MTILTPVIIIHRCSETYNNIQQFIEYTQKPKEKAMIILSMTGERLKGMLLVMTASMSWGTTGILQALAPADAHPLTVGSVRVVLAAVTMIIYNKWKGKSVINILKKAPKGALIITVLGVMGYQFAFFSALKLTGVSIGSMIAIGIAPIIAGLFGSVFENEPLSKRWIISTAVAIFGCFLLLGGSSSASFSVDGKGVTLAFVAAFCFAFLGLGMKRLGTSLDTIETATAATVASLVIGVPVLILFNPLWILTTRGLIIASILGIISEALPMCFFAIGLKKIYLRDAYTLSLFEPLTACFLSAIVLGERLETLPLIGAGLIMCGILLLPSSSTPQGKKNLARES